MEIAPSMPAGPMTDDTDQAVIVADLIISGIRHIAPKESAKRLLAWKEDIKSRGSLNLLGPSTKLSLEQVSQGTGITTAGGIGTTDEKEPPSRSCNG